MAMDLEEVFKAALKAHPRWNNVQVHYILA